MEVRKIDLSNALGKRVKIIKAKDKAMEGKAGELTMPFGNWYMGQIGVFLYEPIDFCKDIYNLDREDEIEFIGEEVEQIGSA